MKRIGIIFMMLTLVTLLGGCVPGDGTYTTDPAGFFWGIWHGWIAPVSLILGLFNETYRVYEVNNTGWFYDFGFYIAVISGFGGVTLTRKSRG
ncbi:hypothetical protein M3591_07955 [Exiguobacterium sp. MER 193]|uniref:hypothetical protein n=1 Tax=Exiguobacterium sp. MER 193 TaxID=2939564 RepID=UPI0011CCA2A0|nr:hypothetical protein [Exiguobacterium sp. MER 193]MCM3280466.1 hypothetical protein [Exiguobacterium sp. MER 193]